MATSHCSEDEKCSVYSGAAAVEERSKSKRTALVLYRKCCWLWKQETGFAAEGNKLTFESYDVGSYRYVQTCTFQGRQVVLL